MDNNIKIFLVANSKYDDFEELEGAVNSTRKIYEFFSDSICNETNIQYLENEKKEKITEELSTFLSNLQKDDIFIFYFCGHGFIPSPSYKFIMATSDTHEQSLSFESGLPFHLLADNLRHFSVNRSIIIIDSCHSGAALTSMGDDSVLLNEYPEGSVLITSTTSMTESFCLEIDGQEQSGFSYYFWKALCSKDTQNNGKRTIKEVFYKAKYLMSKNEQLKKMTPQIKCENDLIDYRFLPTFSQNKIHPFSLEVIDWRITSKCNNNCQFCYALNDGTTNCEDLSKEDIDRIISKINNINFNAICITGGEPTLSDNLVTIAETIHDNNHSVYLSTNGTKYLEKREEIEDYIDKLSLPLDGYDESSNSVNGRNKDSFETVKNILEYYKKNPKRKFNIKISTLLTKKNCNDDHFKKMYALLEQYPIDIWKIYEFIPEARGSRRKNRNKYELSNDDTSKIKNLVNEFSVNSKFIIEIVERKHRNAAYFIIQPNGTVMIPIENNRNETVDEIAIGNLLNSKNSDILSDWYEKVNYDNYINNIRVRDYKRSIILTEIQKNVLQKIVSNVGLPSISQMSKELSIEETEVETAFNDLHNLRVIKTTIPILNLECFNLKTYLVTLRIKHNGKLRKQHIAEILCYNKHFGWVSQFSNGDFRIAIFSKNSTKKVDDIVESEIANYLQGDLVSYETQTLEVAYAFGEVNLFNKKTERGSFELHEKKKSFTSKISLEEYNLLEKFKTLNQLTVENINDSYFEEEYDVMPIIDNLVKKNVVEKLHAIIDTKLIGYNWYIVFVTQTTHGQRIDKKEFIEYLFENFNSLTHINCFEDRGISTECIMDFEIHVKSEDDVKKVIRIIENEYSNLRLNYSQITQEHKFEFTTNTVLETIFDHIEVL